MKTNKLSRRFLLLFIIGLATIVVSANPTRISYQGFLADSGGVPLNDTVSLTFTLWDDSTGGTDHWTETHPAVIVDSGRFSVLLGELNSIPASLFKQYDLYLGIAVNGDPEMTPRSPLVSGGYSHYSIYADSSDWAALAMRAYTADVALSVVDDAIAFDDIAQNGASDGEIMKWNDVAQQWETAIDETGTGWNWSDSAGHGPDSVVYADSAVFSDSAGAVDAGDIKSGTLDDARLSSNVSLLGPSIGDDEITDGAVSTAKIANDAVTTAKLANNSVTSSDIQNGTILFADMAANNATEGQVMKREGSAWVAAPDETGPSSGWSDTGNDVILQTANDSVGIGTATPTEKLDVSGNIHASGTISSGSSITIDGTANTITSTSGKVGFGDDTVSTTGAVETGSFKMATGASDGHILTSDADGVGTWRPASGGSNWSVTDSVLYTNSYWGIARGGVANQLHGDSVHTMINFGQESTTGESGQEYSHQTISGGLSNTARGWYTTVGGGGANTAVGSYATISGGMDNSATATVSNIGGGQSNEASAYGATVSGGVGNTAILGATAVVGGGTYNTAQGVFSGVFSGKLNFAGDEETDTAAFVGGGRDNYAVAVDAIVSGGRYNYASGTNSTIAGGLSNRATGEFGTVSGGISNQATGEDAVVGGGIANWATGLRSIVSGGSNNQATDQNSSVGGGNGNQSTNTYSTVAGGAQNQASGWSSTIGGGRLNQVGGAGSVIAGGHECSIHSSYGVIAGGVRNYVAADYSAILGGYSDTIEATAAYSYLFGIRSKLTEDSTFMVDMPHIWFGDEATGYEFPTSDGTAGQVMATDGTQQLIWVDPPSGSSNWIVIDSVLYTNQYWGIARGGAGNVLFGDSIHTHVNLGIACTTGTVGQDRYYATVSGGYGNTATGYIGSTVGGGMNCNATHAFATVGGGRENVASHQSAAVGGGQYNTASGIESTIGGGSYNAAEAIHSTVPGGYLNTASGTGSVVGGGYFNKSRGMWSTVSGGGGPNSPDSNTAFGDFSIVPGGRSNLAGDHYSFAAGHRAKSIHRGAFVWGDATNADIESQRDNQFRVRANGGVRLDINSSDWIEFYDDATDVITTSTGAHLTTGGDWTNSSDRNRKENFQEINQEDVLNKVADLEITRWNYKNGYEDVTHIGPVAQDFNALFDVGSDDKSISTIDPSGVALVAIQALYDRSKTLQETNDVLLEELKLLRERVEELEKVTKR